MKTRLIIAYIGNLIDIIATLYCIDNGCEELNPLMAWLLQWPAIFVIVKIALMTFVAGLLWIMPETKLTQRCSWIICVSYGLVGIYYILGFIYVFS